MVEVYFLIADGAKGKSATMRALTGARVRGVFSVEIGQPKTVRLCHVELRSLQESPEQLSPAKFIAEVKNSGVDTVIACLRSKQYNGHPGAQAYIDSIINEGWDISGACEISDGRLNLNYHKDLPVVLVPPQRDGHSANQRAAEVRKVWPIS